MKKISGDKFFFGTLFVVMLVYCVVLLTMRQDGNEEVGKESVLLQETKQRVKEKPVAKPKQTAAKEVLANVQEPVKVKGIYVSGPVAGSEKRMKELINLVSSTSLNTMVIDVKNDGGEITYRMNYDKAQRIGATKNYISDIKGLLNDLKKKGIYCIARIVVFKDPILAEKLPSYQIKKKDGTTFRDNQGLAWVNPYEREVWKYNVNIAAKAALQGFDEIQFDYIRFPTASGMKEVTFGPQEKIYDKKDIISQFTQYATGTLEPYGVKLSADVFGTIISSKVDSDLIGQSYTEMAEHLDCISPMIYPSQFAKGCYGVKNPDASPYQIVYKSLLDSKEKLEGNKEVVVRPWLQDFTASWIDGHISYDKERIKDQINAVYASGYDQWILWNANNHYTKEGIVSN